MKYIVLVLSLFSLAACSFTKDTPPPPPVVLTPGSRLLFHNGTQGVWVVCDRGSRIYMSDRGAVGVIAGGCIDGNP